MIIRDWSVVEMIKTSFFMMLWLIMKKLNTEEILKKIVKVVLIQVWKMQFLRETADVFWVLTIKISKFGMLIVTFQIKLCLSILNKSGKLLYWEEVRIKMVKIFRITFWVPQKTVESKYLIMRHIKKLMNNNSSNIKWRMVINQPSDN